MAKVNTKIPLDNFVQNGDLTLDELIAAVAAVNGGVNPGVAEPIRDPSTGRLVRVDLTFPDTVSQAALDAINANPGVPVVVPAIPQQLFADDLSDAAPDGIVLAPVVLNVDGLQEIRVLAGSNRLGLIKNGGSGHVYTDGDELLSAEPVLVQILSTSGSDLVIAPADTLTFNLSATQSLALDIAGTLTIPKITTGFASALFLFVDVNGKVYRSFQRDDGVVVVPIRSYEDSVAAGAL